MKSRKPAEAQLDFIENDPSLLGSDNIASECGDAIPELPAAITVDACPAPEHDLAQYHATLLGDPQAQALAGTMQQADPPALSPCSEHEAIAPSPGILRCRRGRPPGKRNGKTSNAPCFVTARPVLVEEKPPLATFAADGPRYLSVNSVARRYGVSVATIWRWVALGKFPAPWKLASGTSRWAIADLEAYERTLGKTR